MSLPSILETPAWRDGDALVLPVRCTYARRCFRCGGPPTVTVARQLYWHRKAWYLLLFAGLLVYAVVAMFVRRRADLIVGLCARHEAHRRWLLWSGLGGLVGTFGLAWLAVRWDVGAVGVASALSFVVGIGILVYRSNLVTASRIDDWHVWVSNAAPVLLADLPER